MQSSQQTFEVGIILWLQVKKATFSNLPRRIRGLVTQLEVQVGLYDTRLFLLPRTCMTCLLLECLCFSLPGLQKAWTSSGA